MAFLIMFYHCVWLCTFIIGCPTGIRYSPTRVFSNTDKDPHTHIIPEKVTDYCNQVKMHIIACRSIVLTHLSQRGHVRNCHNQIVLDSEMKGVKGIQTTKIWREYFPLNSCRKCSNGFTVFFRVSEIWGD